MTDKNKSGFDRFVEVFVLGFNPLITVLGLIALFFEKLQHGGFLILIAALFVLSVLAVVYTFRPTILRNMGWKAANFNHLNQIFLESEAICS